MKEEPYRVIYSGRATNQYLVQHFQGKGRGYKTVATLDSLEDAQEAAENFKKEDEAELESFRNFFNKNQK